IDTGTGLTGGGDLSQDRTIALDATTQSALALATSAVQPGDLAAVATSGDFGDLSDVPAMVSSLGALSDPDADRIVFWDDSADALAFLEIGTGLEISGTSLQLTSAAQNALTLAATALQPGDNISALTNDTGYITGIGGFSIGDLADVNIGTPGSGEDGYALVWDNDEGEFVLAPVSGGGGTVTSVAVSVPTGFTVTGSPITSSGTIEIEYDTGYQGFTSAEAALIASAVQPGDLAAVAFSGDYDDLTNVPSTFPPAAHTHNASDINAGTLADARLSSNVALRNAENPCTAQVVITGTHATDTRIRRGDTTGILRLLGGTSADGTTGGHIALFGADFGGARSGGADFNAGTGGIARVQAPSGTVELNAN